MKKILLSVAIASEVLSCTPKKTEIRVYPIPQERIITIESYSSAGFEVVSTINGSESLIGGFVVRTDKGTGFYFNTDPQGSYEPPKGRVCCEGFWSEPDKRFIVDNLINPTLVKGYAYTPKDNTPFIVDEIKLEFLITDCKEMK